jgi:DNA-binding CsgD family transcriptional regulator
MAKVAKGKGTQMYSSASLNKSEANDRAQLPDTASHAEDAYNIALVNGLSAAAAGGSLASAPRQLDISRARARWERYREALTGENAEIAMLPSLDLLLALRKPGETWVVAFDPEELALEQFDYLAKLQRAEDLLAAPLRFIALCSHQTNPAKLCRIFQVGAYLSDKSVAPAVLARLCRLAARGARAPLMRFTEEAGLSSAERRAFFAECAGLSKCEAADELGCSPRTLETYWSRIFAKLRIRSTDGVVAAALRFSMLDSWGTEARA